MIFSDALSRLKARFSVDHESDLGTAATDAQYAAELNIGLKTVSRECYFLFTEKATLTIPTSTTGAARLNLFDSTVCSQRVFLPTAVVINGSILTEHPPGMLSTDAPDWLTVAASPNPAWWFNLDQSDILIYPGGNANAAAASNYVAGFYEHPAYDVSNNANTNILGPDELAYMAIDQAYLNISKNYTTAESEERRARMMADYVAKRDYWKDFNKGMYASTPEIQYVGSKRRRLFLWGGW